MSKNAQNVNQGMGAVESAVAQSRSLVTEFTNALIHFIHLLNRACQLQKNPDPVLLFRQLSAKPTDRAEALWPYRNFKQRYPGCGSFEAWERPLRVGDV